MAIIAKSVASKHYKHHTNVSIPKLTAEPDLTIAMPLIMVGLVIRVTVG